MCHTVPTNEVNGNLLPCLCNHPKLNALKHLIIITYKATYQLESHLKIGEASIFAHGIQDDTLNVVEICTWVQAW
jgi:hypothetical protein